MPIYYKKVNGDTNDLGLIESGLGASSGGGAATITTTSIGSSSSSSSNGFFSGVQKKMLGGFAGNSRPSLRAGSSTGGEVELENITASFCGSDEDHLDDLHLNGDDAHQTSYESLLLKSRTLSGDRDRLMTKFGAVTVVKQLPAGVPQADQCSPSPSKSSSAPVRPVIVTYHDIGLNYFSNFESFFTRVNVKTLLQDFRIYHINAPGQEESADDLPHVGYQFPTMDDLAEQLGEICRHYNIQEFIGFGYGAGANVLSRFALANADMIEALFLINPSATTSTWSEWFYQRMNLRTLGQQLATMSAPITTSSSSSSSSSTLSNNGSAQSNGFSDVKFSPLDRGPPNKENNISSARVMLPSSLGTLPGTIQDYFMWHLFGNISLPDRMLDEEAMSFYRRYFASHRTVNLHNLGLFIASYIARTALGITRDDKLNNFKCPVAILCGDYSPHVDESVKMNGRLDPTNSTWMKLADCAMPLEEQPSKVAEVLRLFLQGLGYTLKRALRNERSFLAGKSMPCLAYYQKQNEKLAELRRGTSIGVNEV